MQVNSLAKQPKLLFFLFAALLAVLLLAGIWYSLPDTQPAAAHDTIAAAASPRSSNVLPDRQPQATAASRLLFATEPDLPPRSAPAFKMLPGKGADSSAGDKKGQGTASSRLKLTGIITGPGQQAAVISIAGHSQRYSLQDNVDGYILTAITPDGVTLSGSDCQLQLTLSTASPMQRHEH